MTHFINTALLALVFLSGCSITVPMSPDKPEFNRFVGAPLPGTGVTVIPMIQGKATIPACAAASAASCFSLRDSVHTTYFIRHPKGSFLVDAGMSSKGREDVDRFSIPTRWAMRYEPMGSLPEQLQRAGVGPGFMVVMTHLHWDHTSGLVDMVNPIVLTGPGEKESMDAPHDPGVVVPQHMEGATMRTFAWDGPPLENFEASHDLFGDGAVVLVPLPGHTPGSIGIMVNHFKGYRLLFIGDTAWSTDGIADPSHKAAPMSRVADKDANLLGESLWRLHHLQQKDPMLIIVPTHDGDAYKKVLRITEL